MKHEMAALTPGDTFEHEHGVDGDGRHRGQHRVRAIVRLVGAYEAA